MKTIGILLLALFVGFAGYQFVYPKLDEWAQFKTLTEKTLIPQPQPPAPVAQIEPPKASFNEPPKPEPKMEEPKPEPKPVEPKPEPVVMQEPPKKEPNPDEFQPPVFAPIEELTKGWKEIPKSAFNPPRPVKILKDMEFIVTVNGNKLGTKVASGGQVFAVGQDGDKILVAPSPQSPAHVAVALEETNLKELLSQAYEASKVARTEDARRQWEFKRKAKDNPVVAANVPPKPGAPTGSHKEKPERSPDGSYPILLASMKAGQVTEITPANIKKWGDLQAEKIDGNEYYTVIVDYVTKTMFGDFPTSAQARIRDGKVVKWIYTGSGEVVP